MPMLDYVVSNSALKLENAKSQDNEQELEYIKKVTGTSTYKNHHRYTLIRVEKEFSLSFVCKPKLLV